MVEVIFKGPAGTSPQAAIIQTSNGDSIFNNSPVMLPSLGSNHVAGAYRTMVSPASVISAYVTPPSTALHTWAMIAYVYRSGNGIGSTSSGVYAQPLILNTNWMFNLPIPVTPATKTVEILTPIVELDNAIDRIAIVTVSTAGISQSDTLMVPNAGTSLNMHTITLTNVPAAADKVTVNFISPSNGSGDSFIGSAMVTVNNSCANT